MKSSENTTSDPDVRSLYSLLPSLNDLLLDPRFSAIVQLESHSTVVRSTRAVLHRVKEEIAEGKHTLASLNQRLAGLHLAVAGEINQNKRYSLRRVINATGVILHTNLGRAPLSVSALEHVVEIAAGYSNLELDLETGERSRRDVHAEALLLQLLSNKTRAIDEDSADSARAAVVVNNCAAATFLALNSLAEGAEVIVSRGELVEIGGGFRIPEILAKSGARMREVGTTNRTRLLDYENAISADTGLILRVHQSNFSIEGFTERPSLQDLVALGKRKNVPVFNDQGTGLVSSLEDLGVGAEPTLPESFRLGVDLVAASGDKLLGGPQCGLLVGRVDLIDRIRKNPLLRTFRVDKLTYAALEATLMDHLCGEAYTDREYAACACVRNSQAVRMGCRPGVLRRTFCRSGSGPQPYRWRNRASGSPAELSRISSPRNAAASSLAAGAARAGSSRDRPGMRGRCLAGPSYR